jgi:hypothetical protein
MASTCDYAPTASPTRPTSRPWSTAFHATNHDHAAFSRIAHDQLVVTYCGGLTAIASDGVREQLVECVGVHGVGHGPQPTHGLTKAPDLKVKQLFAATVA